MRVMTKAQIAKATFDLLTTTGECTLPTKHIWRVGYIYAEIVLRDFGLVTRADFERINFDQLNEAFEAYQIEQDEHWARRQSFC